MYVTGDIIKPTIRKHLVPIALFGIDHQLRHVVDVAQIGSRGDVRVLFTFLLLSCTTNIESRPIIIQEKLCDQKFRVKLR